MQRKWNMATKHGKPTVIEIYTASTDASAGPLIVTKAVSMRRR